MAITAVAWISKLRPQCNLLPDLGNPYEIILFL